MMTMTAVAAAELDQFDLILMDVHMPKIDGFEATATIRSQEAVAGERIPFVALTAQALQGDKGALHRSRHG